MTNTLTESQIRDAALESVVAEEDLESTLWRVVDGLRAINARGQRCSPE